MKLPTQINGIILGVIFCAISACFDVYVSYITQSLNSAVVIFYCFISSTLLFLVISFTKSGSGIIIKLRKKWPLVILVNIAVVLNWGGLIISLRYLEPAIVGIASIACGPAITIILSRFLDKKQIKNDIFETIISWLILAGVLIMLYNSLVGKSGVINTSLQDRAIGVACVIISALGTVLYTFFSRDLYKDKWSTSEILSWRNVLMLLLTIIYCFSYNISLKLKPEMFLSISILVILGHLLPVFLIQKTISILTPIHVSLLLLLLPVFTLLFQYIDSRIEFSVESVVAVLVIVTFLTIISVRKLFIFHKDSEASHEKSCNS